MQLLSCLTVGQVITSNPLQKPAIRPAAAPAVTPRNPPAMTKSKDPWSAPYTTPPNVPNTAPATPAMTSPAKGRLTRHKGRESKQEVSIFRILFTLSLDQKAAKKGGGNRLSSGPPTPAAQRSRTPTLPVNHARANTADAGGLRRRPRGLRLSTKDVRTPGGRLRKSLACPGALRFPKSRSSTQQPRT